MGGVFEEEAADEGFYEGVDGGVRGVAVLGLFDLFEQVEEGVAVEWELLGG